MFCCMEYSNAAAYVAVAIITIMQDNHYLVCFSPFSFIFTINFHAQHTLADFCCRTSELCSTQVG